jgi:hypothetical protein
LLIVPELLFFSLHLDEPLLAGAHGWWMLLVRHHRTFSAVFSTFAVAAIALNWDSLRRFTRQEIDSRVDDRTARTACFAIHLIAVGGYIAWVNSIVMTGGLKSADGQWWFFAGAGLAIVAILSWLLALFPTGFWLRWVATSPAAFV